jgi:hypothetical protein
MDDPRRAVAAQIATLLAQIQGPATIVIAAADLHQTFHLGPSRSPSAPADGSPDMQADIWEALGEDALTARQLADRSGYRLNSYFRTTLARMRREGKLIHTPEGYRRRIVDKS